MTAAELVLTLILWLISYRFMGAIIWSFGLGIELLDRIRLVMDPTIDMNIDLYHSVFLTLGISLRVVGVLLYLIAVWKLRKDLKLRGLGI
jgi:hypothetical protein